MSHGRNAYGRRCINDGQPEAATGPQSAAQTPEGRRAPAAGAQDAHGPRSGDSDGTNAHTESAPVRPAPEMSATPETAAPVHRRWETLDDEQLALARWLTARAHELWVAADGELSLAEAVTLAAVQAGPRVTPPADEMTTDGSGR